MKFKKSIAMVVSVVTIMGATQCVTLANDDMNLYVNNKKIKFEDQKPVMLNGRTMVPLRAVFEATGASVEWDSDLKIATIKDGENTVVMKLNEPYFYKNNKVVSLDVPSQILNDRIVIPVRAISEAMDYDVTWDEIRRNVLISTKGKAYKVNAFYDKGFLSTRDIGSYITYEFHDLKVNLNDDSNSDEVTFKPADNSHDVEIIINGKDFSALFAGMGITSLGFVDVQENDGFVEILAVAKGDVSHAYFYRYNGQDLAQIKANNYKDGSIPFLDTLYFDGVSDIITDVDGICFTNPMICAGIYSLEEPKIQRYASDISAAKTINSSVNTDNQTAYNIKYTNEYSPKQYYSGSIARDDIVNAYSIPGNGFSVLSMTVDDIDPAKYEIFVEFANGIKAVLWPYTP